MSDAAIIPLADPEFWHFLGIRMQEALEVAQQIGSGSADAFGPHVTQQICDRANGIFEVLMAFVTHLYEDCP